MFLCDSNYQLCSVCEKFHDDGGLRGGKFVCHDCLDQTLDQTNVNNKGEHNG